VRRAGTRRWRLLFRTPHEPARRGEAESEGRSKHSLPVSTVRPSEQGLDLSVNSTQRCTVVRPAGELDAATVPALEQSLADAISVGRPVEIDLRAASFVDSSALWAITLAHTTCRRRGIPMSLRPGPPRVQQVFEVTGLYDLLPFLTDEPGAS